MKSQSLNSFLSLLIVVMLVTKSLFCVSAFAPTGVHHQNYNILARRKLVSLHESTEEQQYQEQQLELQQQQQQQQQSPVEMFLAEYYPSFFNLVLCNAVDVLKALRQSSDTGTSFATIFAPNDGAFEALGDKKIQQLRDPRNLETCSKIAAYHVIVDDDQLVTAELILDENANIGGVLTLGGEVPVGPSQSGGLLGFGAKADGGVVVGPTGKIVQSALLGPTVVVHEVDGLISPSLLWRYMDQLRLPGL